MLGGALRDLLTGCLAGCLLLVLLFVAFGVLGLVFAAFQSGA